MSAYLLGWMAGVLLVALIDPDAVIAATCGVAPVLVAPGAC